MKSWPIIVLALVLAGPVAPVRGQEADPPPEAAPGDEERAAVDEEAVAAGEEGAEGGENESADPTDPSGDLPPEIQAIHDWEFELTPTDNAPDATGMVKVTENDGPAAFVVEITGLPVVDSLDSEGRDVNAYTIWIVPSKEQVRESALAGVLAVDPNGRSRFEGETQLTTFGIIVTATPDGAPEQISGVPVLTGIPIVPSEEPVTEQPEQAPLSEEPTPSDETTPPPGENEPS